LLNQYFNKYQPIFLEASLSIAQNGTFTGVTPTNQIWESSYSTGSNQSLAVSNVLMTKLAETSWGAEFINNIRDAERYSFDKSGRLIIITTDKTLTFIRL
jgi:heat shock protein HslJ